MELCVLLGTVNTFHNYAGLFWNRFSKYALEYAIEEGPTIQGRTQTEQDISASGLHHSC